MPTLMEMPGVQYICMVQKLSYAGFCLILILVILGVGAALLVYAAVRYNYSDKVEMRVFCGIIVATIVFIIMAVGSAIKPKVYAKIRVDGEGQSAVYIIEHYNVESIDGTTWLVEYGEPKEKGEEE